MARDGTDNLNQPTEKTAKIGLVGWGNRHRHFASDKSMCWMQYSKDVIFVVVEIKF
jgi:hypothetical protein